MLTRAAHHAQLRYNDDDVGADTDADRWALEGSFDLDLEQAWHKLDGTGQRRMVRDQALEIVAFFSGDCTDRGLFSWWRLFRSWPFFCLHTNFKPGFFILEVEGYEIQS